MISECSNSEIVNIREKLFLDISTLSPQFNLLSNYDKFLYIFAYSDKRIINLTSLFTLKALLNVKLTASICHCIINMYIS